MTLNPLRILVFALAMPLALLPQAAKQGTAKAAPKAEAAPHAEPAPVSYQLKATGAIVY